MTKTTPTKTTQTQMIEASKGLVTQSRTWATTVREAMWEPWRNAGQDNQMMAVMVDPWLNMTRAAHDRWLDMYETQAHEMIDRGQTVMEQMQKQLQQ